LSRCCFVTFFFLDSFVQAGGGESCEVVGGAVSALETRASL